ncbi:MAG TPA: hypothetical protein VIM51_07955 [Desulfosporosinus sp.]
MVKALDRTSLYDDLEGGKRHFFVFINDVGEPVYQTERPEQTAIFGIAFPDDLTDQEWWGELVENEAQNVAVDAIMKGVQNSEIIKASQREYRAKHPIED